jgi:hypothetical protein
MTAVEFLFEKYKSQNTLLFADDFTQALEMEKQQIEKMYTEEDIDKQISDFKYDLKESTTTFVKQNCEGAIFGLNRLKQFKKEMI